MQKPGRRRAPTLPRSSLRNNCEEPPAPAPGSGSGRLCRLSPSIWAHTHAPEVTGTLTSETFEASGPWGSISIPCWVPKPPGVWLGQG